MPRLQFRGKMGFTNRLRRYEQKLDLSLVISQIEKIDKKLAGVIATAQIVNRLHPRGKSAEREKQAANGKNLRPIIDEDAETSVQLSGLILRDIGWAVP